MLFGVVGDALGQFLRVGEKEVQIKSTSLVEHCGSRIQIRSFPVIGASLCSFPEIERELGRTCCLSHLAFPLLRTEVLHASSVRFLVTFVNVFRKVVSLMNLDRYHRRAAMPARQAEFIARLGQQSSR